MRCQKMSSNQETGMETITMTTDLLIAPITALLYNGPYLITGEGPYLNIYDTKTQNKITSQKIFTSQRIHGIRHSHENVFVIFGQKAFRMLSISWNSELNTCRVQFEMDVRELSDWIWDIQCLDNANHIAVALGHNSVELWDWKQGILIEQVHCEEKCILYSASFVNKSWSQLALFAGTVFNQVLLWRPASGRSKEGRVVPDLRCTGHEGVIFNVQYSFTHKILCSVSDDRSIRLWPVESLDCPSSPVLNDAKLVMYGHSARVWAARLLSKNIISIGEDATCIVWNYEGKILHKFKGHKGRSIWSLAVNKEETMIATGGGDSSIRLWYLDSESHNELAAVEGIHLQHYVQTHNGFDKNDFARTVMLTNNAEVITMTNAGYLLGYQLKTKLWRIITHDARFRSYGITSLSPSHHLVALGNIHGDIKIVHLSSPKYVQLSNAFESKVLGLCWADDQKLVSSGPEGRLILWNVCMTENELTAAKSMMFFLPESRQRWITTAAVLPYGRGILCGDKRGSLHHFPYPVDSNTEPIQPVTTLRGVHGKVGVTDICCHNNNVYSTGRDGTYKEYQFHDNFLQVMNTNKVYKGFEWIEKILIKENGEMQVLGFHTTHFVVWSVSQNQTLFQVDCGGGHRTWGYAELENISCFAFIKARDVFLCKQTGLQKQLILKDSLHGRELTCAKFLERINVKGIGYLLMATGSEDTMVKIVAVDCKTSKAVVIKTLQDHISSVRDLAICESHYSHGIKKHECQNKREEAEKLLFSVGGRCSIKCWRLVIKDNAENLESACTVSLLASYGTLDAKQRRKRMRQRQPLDPDTRYMALQVTSAQDVDKSLPHYNQFLTIAASDGFIRLFNFSEVHKTFINIWSSSWHNVCLLSLTQIIHKLPEGNAVVVCSAGTDGRVALWDITNLIYTYHSGVDKCQRSNEDKFYSEDSCSSKDDISCKGLESNFNLHKLTKDELMNPESSEHAERHLEKAMSAGSSSSVQIKEDVDITGASGIEENHKPLFTKRIHQSGINTMDIVNTGSDYLLASGGDDNAIHVTILKVRIQENGHIKFDVGDSFSIPSAHATLISGVKFLDKHNLLSSSIDQRLNSWKINHNKMKLIGSEFTHVADTSGLNVTIIGEKVYILLHGQGFQLLSTSSKVDE